MKTISDKPNSWSDHTDLLDEQEKEETAAGTYGSASDTKQNAAYLIPGGGDGSKTPPERIVYELSGDLARSPGYKVDLTMKLWVKLEQSYFKSDDKDIETFKTKFEGPDDFKLSFKNKASKPGAQAAIVLNTHALEGKTTIAGLGDGWTIDVKGGLFDASVEKTTDKVSLDVSALYFKLEGTGPITSNNIDDNLFGPIIKADPELEKHVRNGLVIYASFTIKVGIKPEEIKKLRDIKKMTEELEELDKQGEKLNKEADEFKKNIDSKQKDVDKLNKKKLDNDKILDRQKKSINDKTPEWKRKKIQKKIDLREADNKKLLDQLDEADDFIKDNTKKLDDKIDELHDLGEKVAEKSKKVTGLIQKLETKIGKKLAGKVTGTILKKIGATLLKFLGPIGLILDIVDAAGILINIDKVSIGFGDSPPLERVEGEKSENGEGGSTGGGKDGAENQESSESEVEHKHEGESTIKTVGGEKLKTESKGTLSGESNANESEGTIKSSGNLVLNNDINGTLNIEQKGDLTQKLKSEGNSSGKLEYNGTIEGESKGNNTGNLSGSGHIKVSGEGDFTGDVHLEGDQVINKSDNNSNTSDSTNIQNTESISGGSGKGNSGDNKLSDDVQKKLNNNPVAKTAFDIIAIATEGQTFKDDDVEKLIELINLSGLSEEKIKQLSEIVQLSGDMSPEEVLKQINKALGEIKAGRTLSPGTSGNESNSTDSEKKKTEINTPDKNTTISNNPTSTSSEITDHNHPETEKQNAQVKNESENTRHNESSSQNPSTKKEQKENNTTGGDEKKKTKNTGKGGWQTGSLTAYVDKPGHTVHSVYYVYIHNFSSQGTFKPGIYSVNIWVYVDLDNAGGYDKKVQLISKNVYIHTFNFEEKRLEFSFQNDFILENEDKTVMLQMHKSKLIKANYHTK